MKTIKDLNLRLDNPSDDLLNVTKDDLFGIVPAYFADDAKANTPIGEYECDEYDSGYVLMYEYMSHKDTSSCLETKAYRLRRFVELLERLNVSTRYDCQDPYGSSSENPREAIVAYLFFDNDDAEICSLPLVVESGLMTERECRAAFL